MSEQEETCKTCTHYNSDAFFCYSFDINMAEWDRCNSHETYDEMVKRIETTQMYCEGHDRNFPKDYEYCPYCGNKTKKPVIRVVTKVQDSEGETTE